MGQNTLAETMGTKRTRQTHRSINSIRTPHTEKADDIFSVIGSKRGLSNKVAENNRITN